MVIVEARPESATCCCDSQPSLSTDALTNHQDEMPNRFRSSKFNAFVSLTLVSVVSMIYTQWAQLPYSYRTLTPVADPPRWSWGHQEATQIGTEASIPPDQKEKQQSLAKKWKLNEEYQVQLFSASHSRNVTMLLWRAVCDERMRHVNGRVAVIVLVHLLRVPFKSKELAANVTAGWQCLFTWGGGARRRRRWSSYSRVMIYANTPNIECLSVVGCVLAHSAQCPSRVSLHLGSTVTNDLPVERQTPPEDERKGTAVCSHAPLSMDGSLFQRPDFLVGWFEYHRMIGVSGVILPEPWDSPQIRVPSHVWRVYEYYRTLGFLHTFRGAYVTRERVDQMGQRDVYRMVALRKPLHYTYCLLKYALRFSFFMIQDLDEMVAFDLQKYRSVSNVTRAVLESNLLPPNGSAFKMADRRIYPKCDNHTEHSELGIFHTSQLRAGVHMGKSMMHADHCVVMIHHFCHHSLRALGNYSLPMPFLFAITAPSQFLQTTFTEPLLNLDERAEMQLFHYRPNEDQYCQQPANESPWVADWYDELLTRARKVITQIETDSTL